MSCNVCCGKIIIPIVLAIISLGTFHPSHLMIKFLYKFNSTSLNLNLSNPFDQFLFQFSIYRHWIQFLQKRILRSFSLFLLICSLFLWKKPRLNKSTESKKATRKTTSTAITANDFRTKTFYDVNEILKIEIKSNQKYMFRIIVTSHQMIHSITRKK